MVGSPLTKQVVTKGKKFQLDIEAIWENAAGKLVKVKVAADDGDWTFVKPPADCFIMRPDGSVISGIPRL